MPPANAASAPSYSPPPVWEPSRNAIQRLIQYMDVLSIAFNKFRQLSFRLPRHGTPEYSPEARNAMLGQLLDDHRAARRGIFEVGDLAPHYTAKRLADDATATAFAMNLPNPEPAIRHAQIWVRDIGGVGVPKTGEMYTRKWETLFSAQGELLTTYLECRGELISLLARGGFRVPTDIQQRSRFAVVSLVDPGEVPMSVAQLGRLVSEAAEVPAETAERIPAQAPAPPHNPFVADTDAIERITPRIEAEAARYFECLAPLTDAPRAAIPVVPADILGKRRGPRLLSERDPEKWMLYLLIYEDYAANPRERTASKLLERLKTKPAVLALCGGKLRRDVVLAWEKHYKDSRSQYPADRPRDNPSTD